VAVEPSAVMVAQRAGDAAPAVRAYAEALPFPDASFDVAMAMITVHHWTDPATGLAIPDTYIASRYTDDLIKARRTHYEDWIALLVINHLISGADAYVAANLWDFKANIGVVAAARSATIYASVRLRE